MPKGPKGEKRPADTNAAAVMVAKIATGEIEDETSPVPNRAIGGKLGGRQRAEKLSPDERSAIAKAAASARWKKASHKA